MESFWLKVNSVSHGMFPGEFAVVASTSAGREISLFAPERCVMEQKSLLQVTVLDRVGDQTLISLPASPLAFDCSRYVTVPSKDLVKP